ncbi:MAG: PIN domain-containing protein [Candidatus Woesearchaeota archaeon]
MARLYIDTNIIMYALDDTMNLFGKDISASSRVLLFRAAKCEHNVIISDWTLKELEIKKRLSSARILLKILEKKTIKVRKTEEDEEMARSQNPNNVQDELHCILARRAKADYIVTRNTNDFKNSKVPTIKPEQLL